jgi:hypothetical protein
MTATRLMSDKDCVVHVNSHEVRLYSSTDVDARRRTTTDVNVAQIERMQKARLHQVRPSPSMDVDFGNIGKNDFRSVYVRRRA